LVVVVALAAGAQPASATIVYKHANEVWAMNDDGSDQRQLATPAPLGMEGLGTPHVAPNGATVMFGSASQEGGDITHAPSACDDETFLADPSPNPANPAQYAYVGCAGGGRASTARRSGRSRTGRRGPRRP